jgi:hypothetical protein
MDMRQRSLEMEDFQFADWFKRDGTRTRRPSYNAAKDIFVEGMMPNGRLPPLGIHKVFAYNFDVDKEKLLGSCMSDLRENRSENLRADEL